MPEKKVAEIARNNRGAEKKKSRSAYATGVLADKDTGGVPIPIIHWPLMRLLYPVPENDLPVTLPDDVDFQKTGNPLDNHPTWKNISCPACQGDAQRETDTFDTFFESSWYFARFCDPHNKKQSFFKKKNQKNGFP